MGLERKAQDSNNNGYPQQAYGVVGQYEKAAQGSMVAGSTNKRSYQVEAVFDLADLPSTFTGETDYIITIPSGAYVESAKVDVLETVSGGLNFSVGLSEPDGTVIDADGLVAAETATTGWALGAGALVGTTLAADGQLTVGGDRVAGVIRVLVEYNA